MIEVLVMNHPNEEALIAFAYGEGNNEATAEHVKTCAECQRQLDAWQSVRGQLQKWRIEPTRALPRPWTLPSGTKWAAAACVLLSVGFAAAKLTTPRVDLATVRAELSQQLQDQVRQTVAAETNRFTADQTARQQAFQTAVLAAVNQLEIRQVSDHASLRRDVETVALRTQEEFERLAEPDHTVVQPVSR